MVKKINYIISLFKSLIILWLPILLIEETFLFNYIGGVGSLILSVILSFLCLIMYIKNYKKVNENVNHYFYNGFNTLLLIISNIVLGFLFVNLVDLNIFHQCNESGWDCFLFGIEYFLIGFEYALLSIIVLVIWLFGRLIKFLNSRTRKI